MRNLRLNRGESIKHDVIKLKMSISTRRLIFSIYKRTAPTTTNKKWCSTSPPTPVPIIRRKGKGDREMSSPFIDKKQVIATGGSGGDGCIAFSRIFGNEFAGPDGGDGGSGGHVIFKATSAINSLSHLPSKIEGEPGGAGRGSNCTGENGTHTIIPVPLGTMIKTMPPNSTLISDLSLDEQFFVAAKGGGGGKGNKFFASSQNQSPELAEFGGKGESNTFLLEMSIIAEFGLVGYPNAGKSTLLRAISRARPKVASYAFTTLRPHVGVVFFNDMERVTVADIPGLIPDAHRNRGLGIAFLRHIQRCICLIYVIDFSQPDPLDQFDSLHHELEQYDPKMIEKTFIILANKLDTDFAKENFQKFKSDFPQEILPISAKFSFGLKELLVKIRGISDSRKKASAVDLVYNPVREESTGPVKWR